LLYNPLKKIRLTDLRKKLDDARRSTQLFDALQNRYEQLYALEEGCNMVTESKSGNQVWVENDALVNLIETTVEKIEKYRKG